MGRTLSVVHTRPRVRTGGLGAGAAAIVLLIGIVGPANAGGPAGPVFDDGTTHPGFKYVPDVQPAWKVELGDLLQQAKAGTLSPSGAIRYNAIIQGQGVAATGLVPNRSPPPMRRRSL